METMQIDSTPQQQSKASFNTPHSSSSFIDTCTPIKKRKNYSNRMSSSMEITSCETITIQSTTDSNISTLSSGHNTDVDHDDTLLQTASPIPHFQAQSFIRSGLRKDMEEDHILLEQVEGALDSPLKQTFQTNADSMVDSNPNEGFVNTPPRRKRSLDEKQDGHQIPEWRKKEELTSKVDEFSAFSTNASSGSTPNKTTRSRNSSFNTPQHGRSSWFRNVTPNRPSPMSDSASTDSTPTPESTDKNSSPFKDLKNINFSFQKYAPHALHVHCSLMKAKAPTVSMQSDNKVELDGRINYSFDCGLSCISRDNTIMSAYGKHHNKTHAKAIAARRLLMDLYPEFKGNLELIIKYLDRELQDKKLNLRRILPNEVEVTKQQQQIKLANEKQLKEGFNSMDAASDSGSHQQDNKPDVPPNQYNFCHVPFEEAIKVLNELIHIRGYNYPTCQHKEIEETSGTIHQVNMILEMPNDKGVYYSEGRGYDLKFAKGECSWKMLCYVFPHFNSNWYLIRDYVEDLRTKRKMEKLKKREEVLAVRRKLDFTGHQEQSEDSRQVDKSQQEFGKKGEDVLVSKQTQIPPPPPMPRDMNGGGSNYYYSNNMPNVNPMSMYHHPQPQFVPYSPPMNSHSMMFSNNMMNHQHSYWYHPYQNNHCYCSSCVANNANIPSPYFPQQHSLFSQQQYQNGEQEHYRSQKH